MLRERIYQYMVTRLRDGDPPTLREVQQAMGLKAVESARAHLEALVDEGRLIKRETHSRAYALPPEERRAIGLRRVPVLGRVQAGGLTLAEQEVEGFLEIERDRYGEELFALKVQGESMKEAGILPGDMVITRKQEGSEHGDIVVALVEDEATVKTLHLHGGSARDRVVLQPANPEFEPLEIPADELRLLGKVVEVRRYYELVPIISESD